MVVGYAVLSGLLAIAVAAVVGRATGPPDPLLAVAFLAGEALVLLTLTLPSGRVCRRSRRARSRSSRFGLGWMAGVMAGVGAALGVAGLATAAEVSRWLLPTDGLWRGVIYGLEPPLVVLIAAGREPALANANPFYAATPPPLPFVVWSVAWIAIVLGAATWAFERRDL